VGHQAEFSSIYLRVQFCGGNHTPEKRCAFANIDFVVESGASACHGRGAVRAEASGGDVY